MVDFQTKAEGFDKVAMTDARARLPELTSSVAAGRQEAVELCRRDTPAALLVSHSRFAVFVKTLSSKQSPDRRHRRQLAWLITDQWLGAAPAHLREPQIAELERIPAHRLFALYQANPNRPELETLLKAGLEQTLVDRLKRRRKVARAIREAEDEGLYDAAEHATSKIDVEEDDDQNP